MKTKKKLGLFPKVVIAIICGWLLGMILPTFGVRLLKTFNVIFAQLLKFIVPLLVLGLVTPSIANMGKGAGKMLLTVMIIAYVSTICAGFVSYACCNSVFPRILTVGELTSETAKATVFEPFIDLKIPPICDILTALVLSFMVGIGIIATDAAGLKKGFDEFGAIVKITIENVIIPLLPIYIFTMITEMSAKGVFAQIAGAGAKIIITGFSISILYLIIQFCIAGAIVGKNPFKCLWNMLPAYLTGLSICSSSAVIPVTHKCTLKNGVSEEISSFVVPLCSTVHMCGSSIKLAATSIAIAYITGMEIPFSVYVNFVMMQGIAAVAAPGVMGGVLMASIGLLETIMGFSPEQTALVMTIYLAFDGYGPACNVTGDGAIAIVCERFFGKKKAA